MPREGKPFEELITWINSCLHESAEILPNQYLPDKDTGEPRQIDILIRLRDGPTMFTGIVEVRDRSRPVGVEYIEQVISKIRSVKADSAFIVSRSGYYDSAKKKASENGIRLLSYEEAKAGDWSEWIKCHNFIVYECQFDKVLIRLGDTDATAGYKEISMDPQILSRVQSDENSKVLTDSSGNELFSLKDIVASAINKHTDYFFHDLKPGEAPVRRTFTLPTNLNPRLWIRNNEGNLIEIGALGIEADFWIEKRDYPFRLQRYRNTESELSLAEVAATDWEIAGQKYTLELLASGSGKFVSKKLQIRVHRNSD